MKNESEINYLMSIKQYQSSVESFKIKINKLY